MAWVSTDREIEAVMRQAAEARTAALRAAPRAVLRAAGASLHGVLESFRTWQVRRASIRTLESLDDHALKDIGIGRDEIEVAVDGQLDRPQPPVLSQAAAVRPRHGATAAAPIAATPISAANDNAAAAALRIQP